MIRLQGVQICAGTLELTGIDADIRTCDYVVVMGRTGSGKTTILEAICGLRPIEHGRIEVAGRDVTRLPPAAREIGYVPQDLALFDTMSVRENLAFAPRIRGRSAGWIDDRIDRLASLLHIDELLDRSVRRLSGGEAQRVALGRALSFDPPVLLLDEPLSALDEPTRNDAYDLLRRVRSETGVTVMHVTHSRAEADALATRRLLLEDGRISCQTPDHRVAEDPGSPPPDPPSNVLR